MPKKLELTLLGSLGIRRDGIPVTDFKSSKAHALLCYLAVTGRPQTRRALAALLWGDMPEAKARMNLSQALTRLRRLYADHLDITRQAIAFNKDNPYWLDVEIFQIHIGDASTKPHRDRLREIVDLYQGDFLEEFYVRNAPDFEAWVLGQRVRLRELALQALHTLVVHYTQQGEAGWATAIEYATRLLAIEPWHEESHRQLMLLLALGGKRSAALTQFEKCRQILAEELDVEPGPETITLYEQIRDGKLSRDTKYLPSGGERLMPHLQPPGPNLLPGFMKYDIAPESPPTVFVARKQELSELRATLETTREGKGQILFIIGGAGRGKTRLVQEFARQAQVKDPDLIVVSGYCNAHTGIGDPYLPFREALTMLAGEVEAKWAGGLMASQHARRLWELMPITMPALVKQAPDLIGSFIPVETLLERAAAFAPHKAPWLEQLMTITASAPSTGLEQKQIFTQYTALLKSIAAQHPVVLILEDLQWIDTSSNDLLFHLSRQVGDSRILLVGTYRPEEIALNRGDIRHPLSDIISELKRRHGDIWLDLGDLAPAEGRRFVTALLDTQPNRLDAAFREKLFQYTGGHALFTVELLREMVEQGDIREDEAGYYVEGETINWKSLPPKVEGVIERRTNRLADQMQAVLTVASIEGERFTAEIVARVLQWDERTLVQRLSRELDKRQRLITAQALERVGQQRLSRYRFRHHLFQHYLYHRLDEMERAYLHEEVGQALEALYGQQTVQIAVYLARHFQEAGLVTKAITYLRQAADRARQLFALAEALQLYSQAIELAQGHPQAVDHQILLGLYEHRSQIYSLTGHFDQAVADLQLIRQAAREAADASQERAGLIRLGQVFRKAEKHADAVRHLTEALEVSRAMGDQHAVADALYHLGTVIWDEGDNTRARAHHQEAVDICRALELTDVVAVQALHGLGETAWMAGEPDLAITLLGESLTLARQIGDKSYEVENLQMMGFASAGTMGNADYRQAQTYFNQSLAISEATELVWHSVATLHALGLTQGCRGDYKQGLATIHRSLTMAESLGLTRYRTVALDQLGYLFMDLNLLGEAAEAFTLGIDLALQTKFYYWLPRLQAHLAISHLRQGDLSLESELQSALVLARRNGQGIHIAHCLEGLAELTVARGEPTQAIHYADELLALAEPYGLHEMVAQAYRWRGEAMLAAGQLDAAEDELKQAASLATEVGRVRLQWDIHEALHKLYENRGQAELAHQQKRIVRSIVAHLSDNLQPVELRTGWPISRS